MVATEQRRAAQALALDVISEHGTDGEARAVYMEAAVPQFPYVGAADLVECWNDAVGVDPKTSQPRLSWSERKERLGRREIVAGEVDESY